MTYLLDTNAWLRLFNTPEKIKQSVRRKLLAETELALSPFSLIEVAQKNAKRPLFNLPLAEWFRLSIPPGRILLQRVTPPIAAQAYNLGDGFHGDPADRIIAATSIIYKLVLVTSDKQLLGDAQINTLSTF